MHILITGVSGLVGSALAAELLQRGHSVTGLGRAVQPPSYLPETISYARADLTKPGEVTGVVQKHMPDAIVHAAAMSKPNDCELQPDLCYQVNVNATQHLLQAMHPGCYFLFLSTDFVFGHDGPYAEEDAYAPLNVYGRSKMEAELAVQASGKPYGIVRTVLVYGKPLNPLHSTFPQWVKHQLANSNAVSVFTDQQRTATYLGDLVWGLSEMIERRQQGTYHICGEEVWSPYEMSVAVAKQLQTDPARIRPITRDHMQEAAMRPRRATLHIARAKADLGLKPTSFLSVLPDLV